MAAPWAARTFAGLTCHSSVSLLGTPSSRSTAQLPSEVDTRFASICCVCVIGSADNPIAVHHHSLTTSHHQQLQQHAYHHVSRTRPSDRLSLVFPAVHPSIRPSIHHRLLVPLLLVLPSLAMQAPPAYNSATGGVPPSDPNYAGGAPTSHPAPPPRSQAGHSVVGDWQTSCLGVCCDAPGICLYAELYAAQRSTLSHDTVLAVYRQQPHAIQSPPLLVLSSSSDARRSIHLPFCSFFLRASVCRVSCLPCLVVSQRLELMRTHSPPLNEYTCCMDRVGGQSDRHSNTPTEDRSCSPADGASACGAPRSCSVPTTDCPAVRLPSLCVSGVSPTIVSGAAVGQYATAADGGLCCSAPLLLSHSPLAM